MLLMPSRKLTGNGLITTPHRKSKRPEAVNNSTIRMILPSLHAAAPCTRSWLLVLLVLLGGHDVHHLVSGHGYLSSPRSRNLLAYEDTVWWPLTENDPAPETCPQCLNKGGTAGACGIAGDRNYDTPKNALGGAMPTMPQATYTQGQDIIVNVTLTAHHKGHFIFSACPVLSSTDIPSLDCFAQHRLLFVEDIIYGANADPNYPERAYIAPMTDPNYVPDYSASNALIEYSFKMKLPQDVFGELVLIQWYYLTANSCFHDGYLEYNWPEAWAGNTGTSTSHCGEVSPDGGAVPEQFWNCAEVKIIQDPSIVIVPSPTPPVTAPATTAATTTAVESSTSASVAVPSTTQTTSVFTDISSSSSSSATHGKTIIGYYASWQWYDRNQKAAPENMDFTKLQRVNFAFFQTDTQGNIWGTDSWADPNVLFGPYNWNPTEGSKEYCSWDSPTERACSHHTYELGLIHLVHAAGAEIYPSIGGWTLSDAFPAMAASATARATFAENCVKLISDYGFDGIDIDWEYPGYVEHSGTTSDRDNFNLLLSDVRAKLDELGAQTGRFYGLTAALPCGPSNIANMDIAHVASTLSELNLMTYDFHGAFSETTGTNAPIYFQGWGEEDFDVHSCVENWLASGVSREKINIGLPFYGRSFAGATGLNQPHSGADQIAWGIDDGTPQYFNIVAQLPYMTSVWDKTTWTQYAFFENGGLVSYDNENAICAKVQYANTNNLGGFIIWELSGDLMDDLSTPLLDVTNTKLNNPDFNCGEPGIFPAADGGDLPSVIQAPVSTPGFSPTLDQSTSSVSFPSTSTSESSPDGSKSAYIQCGGAGSTFNVADSKSLDLSFGYELHRQSGVPLSTALTELRSTMLENIAEQLDCAGTSSAVRRLQSAILEASQVYVKAIESSQPELPQNAQCTVPISGMDVPTICHAVIGTMTARFEKETSDEIVNAVLEELLLFIQSNMASDSYVSSNVMKVIYVGPNEAVVSQAQAHSQGGGSASMIVAIVMSIIVLLLAVLFMVVVTKRKRRSKNSSELCTELEYGATSETLPISDTEQTWRKALIIDDTWRKALTTYERNSNVIHPDQVEKGVRNADSAVERTINNVEGQEYDETVMRAKQILDEERKRRRKKRYEAQDVKLANDQPESSYDQSIIYADPIEEWGQDEMNEVSVAQDVHSPVDAIDEVVSVTSSDSELLNQSSAGIEHAYFDDEHNAEGSIGVGQEEPEQLFEANFATAG